MAATEVDDNWLNAVQEEIISVLTAAGIVPQTAATETSNQLLAAIAALRTAAFTGTNQLLAHDGYQKLPGGLIIQWGAATTVSGSATVTYPIAFPSSARAVALLPINSSPFFISSTGAGVTSMTVGGWSSSGAAAASSFYWFVIGY